jgi:hypothetical protein
MSATSWALSAFVAALLTFVFREVLIGVTGWIAQHIIAHASKRLPPDQRNLRHEEWLAEYAAIIAKGLHLTGVIHACGTYVGAVRITRNQQHATTIKRSLSRFREAASNLGLWITVIIGGPLGVITTVVVFTTIATLVVYYTFHQIIVLIAAALISFILSAAFALWMFIRANSAWL